MELVGEIDISGATALRDRFDSVTRRRLAKVVVDLRPVTFIDCSGLSLLVQARRRLRERGGTSSCAQTR
ncbi:STAS domain-containing protein [Streptomyces sp. NBC_01092]|uniref:STAS domain-containing protein n=1 Tax=Streptomyces sp. NBC_01092 TaxID=2903748 RepID=UPI0038661213|nr:STAS domain-containing protein [Streptomyces sp. NBC_01092]